MDIHNVRRLLKTKSIYDIPLRVTYYARVSSESDEQLNSLGNQVSYYEDLIKRNIKWTFVPGYIDEGLSGISTRKRENFNRMISDAAEDKFDLILEAQETFFNPPNPKCNDMFSFFVKEDRMDETGVDFVDLQPGDILLSLSTHSFGWRHGHAGLVIDDESVLESEVIGTKSKINPLYHFGTYSNYAVLRIKDVTPKQQEEVVAFAKENLQDVWYSVAAGFVGDKAPSCESDDFRVQCAYLVWYAYNYFGYDLDSDGGCLVSTYDILHSDKLEIVQIFGMNPKEFTN